MKGTVPNSQPICWYCEETVHQYATQCPYCQHDLNEPENTKKETSKASTIKNPKELSGKITQMPQPYKIQMVTAREIKAGDDELTLQAARKQEELAREFEKMQKENEQVTLMQKPSPQNEQEVQQVGANVLVPLLLLLTGSFFFFFSIILKLCAKDGFFTLSWNAKLWPYYFIPATCALIAGFLSLRNIEE